MGKLTWKPVLYKNHTNKYVVKCNLIQFSHLNNCVKLKCWYGVTQMECVSFGIRQNCAVI